MNGVGLTLPDNIDSRKQIKTFVLGEISIGINQLRYCYQYLTNTQYYFIY